MTHADAVVAEQSDVSKPRPVPVRRNMKQEVAVSAAKSDVEEIAIPVPQVQMIVIPFPVPQVMMQGVVDIPEVKQMGLNWRAAISEDGSDCRGGQGYSPERILKPAGERTLVRERVS